MLLSYKRIRENVLPPERANPSDAGMDVFFCPDAFVNVKGDCMSFKNPDGDIVVDIEPGGNAILSTGLKFGIPHGTYLEVKNRGSMGAKKSLVCGAHVIDSGYSGEVFIDLHNVGNKTQRIKVGDKIAQLVHLPCIPSVPLEAANEKSLYGMYPITMSDRGEGALGSTDVLKKENEELKAKVAELTKYAMSLNQRLSNNEVK